MTGPWGFSVQHIKNPREGEAPVSGWWVALPHQCDQWDIAGEEYGPVTREEAIDRLTSFLMEGRRALDALRAGDKFGEPA